MTSGGKSMITLRKILGASVVLVALLAYLPATEAHAKIEGHTGTSPTPVFNLTAKEGRISTGEANSLLIWGFADDDGQDNPQSIKGGVQYPGPTLIVKEGDVVTINLTNTLAEPVSLVFPGLDMQTSTVPVFNRGDKSKLTSLTPEALPGGKQLYTFIASRPGTFYYQSGSNQDIQIRMGLFGAIIVRPAQTTSKLYTNVYPNHQTTDRTFTKFAYNEAGAPNQITAPGGATISNVGASTGYDREFLYLVSEMDPDFQLWMDLVADRTKPVNYADWKDVSLRKTFIQWKANYWFANGRNAPDDMTEDYNRTLPAQPYSCQPLMHPGEAILTRFINMGRDFHPLHTHGQHQRIVGGDGLIKSSVAVGPGDPAYVAQTTLTGADLSTEEFTLTLSAGNTLDSIFTWTGKDLGWDAYGHNPGDLPAPYEYLPDHVGFVKTAQQTAFDSAAYGRDPSNRFAPLLGSGNPGPLQAGPTNFSADQLSFTFGNWFSGSPFLGGNLPLPPSNVSFNLGNGYYFMWHSHAEREITNNNIFPGGMLTMMGVIPWKTKITPAEMPYD